MSEIAELKSELARLRIKRTESRDLDIRRVLDERIGQIENQILAFAAKPAEEPEIEIPIEPATPEQIAEADQLVRQARVEKMRNNATGATDLLRRASQIAPGAPAVLEALGDDLSARRRYAEAARAYKQAFQFDATNVGLERKHALAVMGKANAGSIEDQLRSDFGGGSGSMVNPKAAMLLSVVVPGLGHVVQGKLYGYAILAGWIICLIWLATKTADLALLMAMFNGGKQPASYSVVVPLFLMLILWVGSIASLSGGVKTPKAEPKARPQPPVNLPFE